MTISRWKSISEIHEENLLKNAVPDSFLPLNVSQLLPENNEKDFQLTFVAVGPMLIDSLAAGEDILTAAHKAHISPDKAVKLLATPEFRKFVEAYLSIGDLKDRDSRIRLAKTILASQIANGIISKKKEPLDFLEYIRRENEAKKGSSSIVVQIQNNSVPRPYTIKEADLRSLDKEEIPNGNGSS